LIYSDNVEKQKRIKNIVVRGLSESDDITDWFSQRNINCTGY
jgi:hypothetical protein